MSEVKARYVVGVDVGVPEPPEEHQADLLHHLLELHRALRDQDDLVVTRLSGSPWQVEVALRGLARGGADLLLWGEGLTLAEALRAALAGTKGADG